MSAAMGLKGFLMSSGFIDGGVTGISMLLAKTTGMPLSVLLPAINLPFVVVGYRLLGRAFAVRSVLGIAGLAGVLATVPFPDVTPDLTLTAVFGGFFLGAGIGLAVRGGAVLDGTEIAALLISRRADVLRVGDVILGFNVVLFLVAMSALGVEPALYSILTYLAAARRSFRPARHRRAHRHTIARVRAHPREITADLGRASGFQGYGGMSRTDRTSLPRRDARVILRGEGDRQRNQPPRAFFVLPPAVRRRGRHVRGQTLSRGTAWARRGLRHLLTEPREQRIRQCRRTKCNVPHRAEASASAGARRPARRPKGRRRHLSAPAAGRKTAWPSRHALTS